MEYVHLLLSRMIFLDYFYIHQIFNIEHIQRYKNLYFHILFYEIQVCFLFLTNENNSNNKNHHHVLTVSLFIMLIVFLWQYNAILLLLESLKEWFVFHALSFVLKLKQNIFFHFCHTKHFGIQEQLLDYFSQIFSYHFFWWVIYSFLIVFIYKKFNFSYSFRMCLIFS